MNIKTKLLGDCVNFVDSTKKQNTYFKRFIVLIVIILPLFFLFYVNT